MFVGDVRHATTDPGFSWKLSGASAWPSATTNVSKNRHVLRATRRNARCPAASRPGSGAVVRPGCETHHATVGPASHTAAIRTATSRFSGRLSDVTRISTAETIAAGPIVRQNAVRVLPARFSASAAVSHSSSLRRVTVIRHSALKIASVISHAW